MEVLINVFVTVLFIGHTHACQGPPPTNCDLGYPRGSDLVPFQVKINNYTGPWCICPDGPDYDVCFPKGSSFDGETKAVRKTTDAGCEMYCAVNTDGEEVCSNKCQISDRNLFEYEDVLQLGVNVICNETVTDACCPDRGTLCHYTNMACEKDRCTDLQIDGSCFFCVCPEKPPDEPECPWYPPICSFYHDQTCCTLTPPYECVDVGGHPDSPLRGFLANCEANSSFIDCPGVVTVDDNCCPHGCLESDCSCDGLNRTTVNAWTVELQPAATTGEDQSGKIVGSVSWVRLAESSSVFFQRADGSPFCLHSLEMKLICVDEVHVDINFVNGSTMQKKTDVSFGSAFKVSIGPFVPIYTDVDSVRITYIKAGICSRLSGYIKGLEVETCAES